MGFFEYCFDFFQFFVLFCCCVFCFLVGGVSWVFFSLIKGKFPLIFIKKKKKKKKKPTPANEWCKKAVVCAYKTTLVVNRKE